MQFADQIVVMGAGLLVDLDPVALGSDPVPARIRMLRTTSSGWISEGWSLTRETTPLTLSLIVKPGGSSVTGSP
jgi:hypothetical protein